MIRLCIAIAATLTAGLCAPSLSASPPSSDAKREGGPKSVPLRVSIHYLDGLSGQSSDKPPEIRFLRNGCHLSVLLTNVTEKDIHLWRPYCPQGDDAIRLEFKRNADSKEVGSAHMVRCYTGGSGLPKTLKLVSRDSLIYRVDFSESWSLPFVLEPGTSSSFLVRAVYDSKPLDPKRSYRPADAEKVWQGRIETPWEEVRVVNVTESKTPTHPNTVTLRE